MIFNFCEYFINGRRFGYENVGDCEAQIFNLQQSSNGLQALILILSRLFFIAFVELNPPTGG
jgi:hypothetical protein